MKHGIALNSGTDALRIIMDAAGIGPGDEVITAAFTFVASVETIVQTGARPVFVDIDPKTFCIDATKVAAAITPRTKAIQPIHLFGQLADVTTITEIADKHELVVIEDAAQAIGSSFNGTPAGNFGIGAGFSFYVTKNLGAAGDAGMILTNNDDIAEASRSIRVHGMGRERYYYDHIGYTSRMDEIQAAVLRVKLTKFHEWNARRAKFAEIYQDVLADSPVALPVISPGNTTTWHQFSIRSDRRDALREFLKERGVDSMIYYPVPIHYHEPYKHFGHGPGSLPKSELAADEILNLPIHSHLSVDQVAFAAKSVAEFCALATRR
jgi:dTDP-4-amino-4,6-dideoxygalactose transaminase